MNERRNIVGSQSQVTNKKMYQYQGSVVDEIIVSLIIKCQWLASSLILIIGMVWLSRRDDYSSK